MAYKQRKDGRYYTRVNIGRGEDGKIKYKYFYGQTQKEVREQERAFTADIQTYGKVLDTTRITLAEWGHEHLFTNLKPNIQHSTFSNYYSLYTIHLAGSFLGKMYVKDIQPIHVQNYLNDKKYLSTSHMKKLRYVIKSIMDAAISNNLIRINPTEKVKLPTSEVEKKEIQILTIEEQRAYIESLKNCKLRTLCLTALYTGMRQGELIALKWDNVDLINNSIRVCESYRITNDYHEDGTSEKLLVKKSPKTESGVRIIPYA